MVIKYREKEYANKDTCTPLSLHANSQDKLFLPIRAG